MLASADMLGNVWLFDMNTGEAAALLKVCLIGLIGLVVLIGRAGGGPASRNVQRDGTQRVPS